MTQFHSFHNFLKRQPDSLSTIRSETRYVGWFHGPSNQPHTTFIEHETYQFALKCFALNVKTDTLANLQVVEDVQNPCYARFFIFKFLGCSWLEIEGLNQNETFIIRITKEFAFLLSPFYHVNVLLKSIVDDCFSNIKYCY